MHEINTQNRNNVETQDVTWKTHNGGKNHESPQAVKQSLYERKYNFEETQRQRPLVLFLATSGDGYTEEATTSLSSLSHALSRSVQETFTMIQQHHKTVP